MIFQKQRRFNPNLNLLRPILGTFLISGTVCLTACNATLQDIANEGGKILAEQMKPTQGEMVGAIKQALNVGVKTATNTLGQPNGFQQNPLVKIPLPTQLNDAANLLRQLGQGHLVDEFELTMNRAAEQAVPKAIDVFTLAISQMTIQDALSIVDGKNPQAATDYFRKTSTSELQTRFLPIVKTATEDTGVTSAYKKAIDKAGILGNFIDPNLKDIDQYITHRATEALFIYVAKEEEKIRENPVARTTELLKKVFGYYQK